MRPDAGNAAVGRHHEHSPRFAPVQRGRQPRASARGRGKSMFPGRTGCASRSARSRSRRRGVCAGRRRSILRFASTTRPGRTRIPRSRSIFDQGLPELRRPWILARGDYESTEPARANRPGPRAAAPAAGPARPRQRHADALRAARASSRPRWSSSRSARTSLPSSCGARSRAAARSSRPTSTIPSPSRWRSGATSSSRSTPTSATRP